MNIYYIGAFRLPNLDAAAPRVLNNAKALREAGHSVSFISWGGAYFDNLKGEDGLYLIDGFEYTITEELDAVGSFFNKLKCRLSRGRKSINLLKNCNKKIDAIIAYNPSYRFNKLLLQLTNKEGILYINDITEWSSVNELRLIDVLPNYLNMRFLERMVKNKIVISDFLNQYYSEGHNIVIPPLCDPCESKWLQNVEDKDIPPIDGITLIYAGNPARKDNLHKVINVVQRMTKEGTNIRFIILGITRERYLSSFAGLLDDQNLDVKIIFKGKISQDMVPAYYKKADFMVLLREPNRKSLAGFPTKFAESMISGIPVITNLTSDLSQYLFDGRNGFIIPDYSGDSLYEILNNKVLKLSATKMKQIKEYTLEMGQVFDYRSKIENLKDFMNKLQ